jgi:hypothetical protein
MSTQLAKQRERIQSHPHRKEEKGEESCKQQAFVNCFRARFKTFSPPPWSFALIENGEELSAL